MYCLQKYSRIPLIRINLDDEPSGNAGNPDNWIFPSKLATLVI